MMFEPEEVTRDQFGYWAHSAFNDAEGEDITTLEEDITFLPVSEGMEFRFIDFFDDAPGELLERYDTAGVVSGATEDYGDVIRAWEPKKPDGEGWFIAAIYDTEDGPYACFARPRAAERCE